MNAKKAKELRYQAQNQTVGEPLVEYEPRSFDQNGREIPRRLKSSCTRGVYKKLKRSV